MSGILFDIIKAAKDSVNTKIDGIVKGVQAAGNIYGGAGTTGFTPSTQQQNQALPANNTQTTAPEQGGVSPQYSLNYKTFQMPDTDFANRIRNYPDNGQENISLFERLRRQY